MVTIRRSLGMFFVAGLALTLILTLVLASNVESKLPYESKVLGIDSIPSESPEMPEAAYDAMKQQVAQMKSAGYVDAPEDAIPSNDALDKSKLMSLDGLKKNIDFVLVAPTWLPVGADFLGGVGEGPNLDGRWESVSLIYETAQGPLRVMQAHPLNGGAVYPEELATVQVHSKPAVALSLRGEKSGRRWNSVAWSENQTEYVVEGPLGIGQLQRVADSLE